MEITTLLTATQLLVIMYTNKDSFRHANKIDYTTIIITQNGIKAIYKVLTIQEENDIMIVMQTRLNNFNTLAKSFNT